MRRGRPSDGRTLSSVLPLVEDVGVSAVGGDLIRGVLGVGDCGLGLLMVAIS